MVGGEVGDMLGSLQELLLCFFIMFFFLDYAGCSVWHAGFL